MCVSAFFVSLFLCIICADDGGCDGVDNVGAGHVIPGMLPYLLVCRAKRALAVLRQHQALSTTSLVLTHQYKTKKKSFQCVDQTRFDSKSESIPSVYIHMYFYILAPNVTSRLTRGAHKHYI